MVASKVLKPYALKLTKDTMDAEDLMQDTILRALKNTDKFESGSNLKAWLYTIMKNIFINNYRKNARMQTVIDSTANEFLINNSNTVNNQAINNFIAEDINKALMKISVELRTPFLMHYKGFKYNEIADKLRLPLGTVKSRIFLARKELTELLKGDYR